MSTIESKRPPIPAGLGCALTLSLALCSVSAGEPAVPLFPESPWNTIQGIQRSAEEGDARAIYLLSTLYRTGTGVARDEYNAFHWCKLAAENGVLEAQFQLGLMYLEGEGVTEDETEAMRGLSLAADQGYPQAGEVLEYILYSDFTYGC